MQVSQIKIFEIPAQAIPAVLADSVTVVIDVLRATSSMTTALFNSCKEIYPVVDVDDAFAMREELGPEPVLLCGERKGVKVDGFDFGNSPLEYDRSRIQGKSLVWTTTNGTKAMQKAENAETIYIASLLNLDTVAKAAAQHDKDINIICSGTNGKPTLEDNVCAGLLARQIVKISPNLVFGNDVEALVQQAETYKDDLYAMMLESKHGLYLSEIGFDKDLKFCSQLNFFSVLVVYDKRVVKLAP